VKRAELQNPGDTYSIRRGPLTTTQLVMYAGASGDFNRIHYDQPFAVEKGLGGVIAHGMLTMAFAASCVTEAYGPEWLISRIDARFTAPVRVGDVVDVTASVERVTQEGLIETTLQAEVDGRVVLRGAAEVMPAANATSQHSGLTA
jgi:acyl dehydratase